MVSLVSLIVFPIHPFPICGQVYPDFSLMVVTGLFSLFPMLGYSIMNGLMVSFRYWMVLLLA